MGRWYITCMNKMKNKKFLSVLAGLFVIFSLCAFTFYVNDQKCPACNGNGSIMVSTNCSNCSGKGQVKDGSNWVKCQSCNGNGKIKVEQCCSKCGGKGVIQDSGHKVGNDYQNKCE